MGMKGGWFRRRPSDDEMAEELETHVAMRAEHDRIDEATARRRLGNTLQTRKAMRRVWIAQWWDELRQDAWFTWRSWRRQPGFALGAILVLALGLGASTALFAALDRVLFRPLPYADSDRLVSVGLLIARSGEPPSLRMQDRSYVQVWDTSPPPFESVTATPGTGMCSIADEQPEQLSCARVESDFLRVLGVRVTAGRDFVPEDEVRGAPVGALISHGLWVRRFGADPDAVGRTLSLESTAEPVKQVPVIGVLPPDFEMPVGTADILLPFQLRPLDPDQTFNVHIMTFARLRPDVTPERAQLMLAPQLPEMLASMPPSSRGTWSVQPLRNRRVGDAARTARLMIGAVAVFLLIACVNVTNLLLTRVAERQREFAVRAALGAGRTRLASLALAESLLLALTAGSVGLVVAFGLLQTFVAMSPPGVPGIAEASIDMRVFVVDASLIAITGVAIGLWPALSVFRAGASQGLRSTSPSSRGVRPRVRFALVTMQVGLTLALLGGSTLLLRSLWNVVNLPLGFDGDRVVTLAATLSPTRYPAGEHVTAFFEELLVRAQATPGAVSAALSDAPAPRGRVLGRARIDVEGRPVEPAARHAVIRIREVTPRYFQIFRTPLIKGRTFEDADRDREPAVVLSESAERILFAGERALDRRVQPYPKGPWYVVVGVVADVRNGQRVIDEPEPEIYAVARRGAWGQAPAVAIGRIGQLALRTTASPVDAEGFLRQIGTDLDPRLPVTVETVDEQVTRLTAHPRFVTWLLSAFAALALLLAASGLYSVASYLVLQRRRDIGVRMAIGAAPRDVARQVVGEAARWIVAGAVAGSALGWMGTRALQAQLYRVEAQDPWSWTGALLALAGVLVIAVLRPAYRAAHVDPVAVLRAD